MTENQAQIERYLSRQMSKSEEAAFEQLMREHPELKDEVFLAAYLEAADRVQEKERWKAIAQAEDLHKQTMDPGQVAAGAKVRPWQTLQMLVRIAALVLLIGLPLGIYFYTNSANYQVNRYLRDAHPPPEITRDDSRGEITDWGAVRDAYLNEEYSEVIRILENAQATDRNSDDRRFYLGLAYLYTAEYQAAQAQLQATIAAESVYREEAEWFLALAKIKTGSRREARDILEKIVREEQWKAEAAERVLQKLR